MCKLRPYRDGRDSAPIPRASPRPSLAVTKNDALPTITGHPQRLECTHETVASREKKELVAVTAAFMSSVAELSWSAERN